MEATALTPADLKYELQARFANLTAEKQEWLLLRRYYASDAACSDALTRMKGWAAEMKRQDADFRRCAELLLTGRPDDVDDVLIDALTKSNALKALIEERKILDVPWADSTGEAISGRLGQVKGGAMKAAIDRVRGSRHTVEHVFTIEEALNEANVVEATGRIVE